MPPPYIEYTFIHFSIDSFSAGMSVLSADETACLQMYTLLHCYELLQASVHVHACTEALALPALAAAVVAVGAATPAVAAI
jgi:hypothetical protein